MTSNKDEIYRLVSELLHGIQHGDPVVLVSFGVSAAMIGLHKITQHRPPRAP
ncbi:hypothetical protein [Pectobacterium brasiliense]|uniref:hypothetical protein n=1 Tax=Pectobacterium brasiliense TaxID=180957 RepID=UPI000AA3AE89